MHHLHFLIPTSVVLLTITSTNAATIQVTGPGSLVAIAQGGHETIAVKLRNVSQEAAEIAVWQVGVSVVPEFGAVGTVEIANFSTPEDYLFTGLPSFGIAHVFGDSLPHPLAIFSDALVNAPPGAGLGGQDSVGAINVTLTASSNALGYFRLLLPATAGDFTDSFWIDPIQPGALPFDNGGPASTVEHRTLAIVRVVAVPEPCGDAAALLMIVAVRFQNRRHRIRCAQHIRRFAPNPPSDESPVFS
jgi:hypothetical protein